MSESGPLWRRLGAVFAHASLTPSERLVLILLEWYAKDGVAWPSVRTMGRRTGLGVRTVYRLVARLEQLGVLDVEHGGGRRRPNHYEITLPPFHGFPDGAGRETLPAGPETVPSVQGNPATVAGEHSRERSKDHSTSRAPNNASLRDAGAAEDPASVSAPGPRGNGGLTPVNPADFAQFRLARRAQRAQAEKGTG